MKNGAILIISTTIFALGITTAVSAADVGVKNINIAEGECTLNFYRDPLPQEGTRYNLRLDAYFRAADARKALPAVDELSSVEIKNGVYPAVALVCGTKHETCNARRSSAELLPVTMKDDANLVFTVEKISDSPRRGSSYSCRMTTDGKPAKARSIPDEPTIFLPESDTLEAQRQDDKDYVNIKQIIQSLDNDHAALVPKSVYTSITNVTKRSAFKYYGPNILHCVFSTIVAAAGATAIACTLGAAAPIVVPAVLGGISSVASTGSYDLAKRQLDREDNEYQDAITEIKQIYRNMVYYAATTFMRTQGKTGYWFVDGEEDDNVRDFIDKAIIIAIKINRQLRLSVEDTVAILNPLLYLHKITKMPIFNSKELATTFAELRKETDAIKQGAHLQAVFSHLDRMDEAIHLHAQDEGLKLALRSSLSQIRFKVLGTHLGDLYVMLDQQNKTAACMYQKIADIISNIGKQENVGAINVASSLDACSDVK